MRNVIERTRAPRRYATGYNLAGKKSFFFFLPLCGNGAEGLKKKKSCHKLRGRRKEAGGNPSMLSTPSPYRENDAPGAEPSSAPTALTFHPLPAQQRQTLVGVNGSHGVSWCDGVLLRTTNSTSSATVGFLSLFIYVTDTPPPPPRASQFKQQRYVRGPRQAL